VLKLFLQTLGWTLAHTPRPLLKLCAGLIGGLLYLLRRRTYLSNLDHAFPARSPEEHRRLARESSRRLVETGLLSLATPFLSESAMREIVRPTAEATELLRSQRASPQPTLLLTPHMAYWEAIATLPIFGPQPAPEIAAIFRPVDNEALNKWIKECRERFGIRLLSRKDGFQEAIKLLRKKGSVFLLYDQNAGMQGALSTLFGRVCSTSELAGLLAQKFSARVFMVYAERIDFWKLNIRCEPLSSDGTTGGTTIAVNQWLESRLSSSENLCASWLWAHERWKNQDIPGKRLRLEAKRNLLSEDLAIRNLTAMPRRTRIWIRMPNWLGDVVMLIPLLRAIRQGRPDAEITLVAKPGFHDLIMQHHLADRMIKLPAQGWGYFLHFWRLRGAYPDCYFLFTNSVRGDLEAWLTGTRQRFGIIRSGKRRPLLSHAFAVPPQFDENTHHQLELWTRFLQHFGLTTPPEIQPLLTSQAVADPVVGLIAGSENNPEKRWPVTHWVELISLLPAKVKIVMFGTHTDRSITDEIAARCSRPAENLAGRTSLPEYCERLRECSVLVTNDTGGMHLANALGVPLVALFGPTNPVRTGPVFAATVTVLQPPDCPPTGRGDLNQLSPARVHDTLLQLHPEWVASV
jgi:heptosyltransferase II